MTMHICGPRIYEFDGWKFEDGYNGPWPLKNDGERRAAAGDKFWDTYYRWGALPEAEREKYRVGGGCWFINTEDGQ